MSRRLSNTSCAFCENSNLASICASCVNYRLNEYHTSLKSLQNDRNKLFRRLQAKLDARKRIDEQHKWRMLHNEKLKELKEQLLGLEKQLSQDKAKLSAASTDLEVKNELLQSSLETLRKTRTELLEKYYKNFNCAQNLGHMAITSELLHKQSVVVKNIVRLFPLRKNLQVSVDGGKKDGSSISYDQICNARLPRGLDPHSVPSYELAASLGYMVQLLNLVTPCLGAPALHNSGFAGSCSCIWQQSSYWNARPSSQSNEYPLFISRQSACSSNSEASWLDKSSSNFGVSSVESERKPSLETANSFNHADASPHCLDGHTDLKKGISLLKKSVACITAYCYFSLGLTVPPDAATFEAFARLLNMLSSSREMRSLLSLKTAKHRNDGQTQRPSKSAWNVNSGLASTTLEDSTHTVVMASGWGNNVSNSMGSFLYSPETNDNKKAESLVDGWDIVERPTLPPPPSQIENVEHWTRAMFLDATKK